MEVLTGALLPALDRADVGLSVTLALLNEREEPIARLGDVFRGDLEGDCEAGVECAEQ